MNKKETKPKIPVMPEELYLVLTGRNTFAHSGRSLFASKFGGYRFTKGQVIVINHPQDILYFYMERKKLSFIEMYSKLPKKYAKLHLVKRSVDLKSPAMKKLKAEMVRKFNDKMAVIMEEEERIAKEKAEAKEAK